MKDIRDWDNLSPKAQLSIAKAFAGKTPDSKTDRKKRAHPEEDIQRAVVKYLRLKHPSVLFIHPANGGYRTKTESKILVGLGQMAGASDILIFCKFRSFSGLALELKAPDGILSNKQEEFGRKITKAGWYFTVAWSYDEAVKIIDEYLKA